MKKKISKKQNLPGGPLVYYSGVEETVLRKDDTLEKELKKQQKSKRVKKQLRNAVCFLSAFAFLLSGSVLAKRGIEMYMVRLEEKNAKDYVLGNEEIEELQNLTEAEAWAQLYKKHPELLKVPFPAGMNYEYALYYAKNPDMVGYLKIDGTNIDTPVPQAQNNKYYLTHDYAGKATSYGAIYAAYGHNLKDFDRNTLLYGHNMKDGSRFAGLLQYRSLDFYRKHPLITFNTLYEKHQWKIYAVFLTNGNAKGDNGYFFDFTFNNCSDACFPEYIAELDKRTLYKTGVDLLPTDKLLTLCTCAFEFNDARLVIVARMVRPGEDAAVDTANAAFRTTPIKYPSSYYSKSSKNPYKDDKKWFLY